MSEMKNEVVVFEEKEICAANSQSEYTLFRGALNEIVPEGLRGDKKIDSLIRTMYDNYYKVVSATHVLAKSVYEFRELTGAELPKIASAFSKGIQKQLSGGYISKLCRAGQVLSTNKLASRISDIEKLAELGRYTPEQVASILTEENGVSMLSGIPATLLTRSQFKAKVDEAFGVAPKAMAPWNMRSFRKSLDAAVKGTVSDAELNKVLTQALEMIDKRLEAQDGAGTVKAA